MIKTFGPKTVLLEHSQAKVELLGGYLKRFLNIISNDKVTNRIELYDLFCGQGLYKDGGEGSPIVALKAIKDLHFVNKAKNNAIPPIDIYFNDIKPEKIEVLKKVIEEKKFHYNEFGKLTFNQSDYRKLLPLITERLSSFTNQKAFIFIDPCGYKELRASDIKSLLATKKSEVLLFLPTQFMYRFDKSGTPEALIDILDELVEYGNWKPNTSAISFVKQFTQGLRSYLGTDYFVDTFLIQKDPNTLYCLFFFSSHIRGFEKMLEAKWDLDEERGEGFRYHKNLDIFSISSGVHPLENSLINFLKMGKKHNSDVYQFILYEGFLPKHANEILNSLQKLGRMSVQADSGLKVRKGAFYVNYEAYKNDPQKVYFKTN